jgi:hypothetical protein
MSKETTSSGVPAPQVELGTLVTCILEGATQQPVLTAGRPAVARPCGIRKARPRFAVSRPDVLPQAPIPPR